MLLCVDLLIIKLLGNAIVLCFLSSMLTADLAAILCFGDYNNHASSSSPVSQQSFTYFVSQLQIT